MMQDILELERPKAVVGEIELITQIDDAIPPCVMSDHTKIHRILLNLIGNAVKFTKKGYVEIGAKLLTCDNEHALIQFHVKDTGIGIAYELQDKVFDRFFRVTPSYKGIYTGHGVGLHIAQSYAHLLGGNILLTSEPNVGTTFYFDLSLRIGDAALLPCKPTRTFSKPPEPIPAAPIATSVKPLVDEHSTSLQSNTPMLLLVEDNAIALMILENVVTNSGCRFMHAVDGFEALILATRNHFDLIITDLGLPELSGIEFTEKLRAHEREQHKPPTPIIGLTAHADNATKQQCIDAGMNNAVTKPITPEQLEEVKSTYLVAFQSTPSAITPSTLQQQSNNPFNMPVYDAQGIVVQLDGFAIFGDHSVWIDMDLPTENKNIILSSFLSEIRQELKELENAYMKGDFVFFDFVILRVRGSTLHFSMDKLSQSCLHLLNDGQANGHMTTAFERLYNQFTSVAEETIEAVKEWLSR